MRIGKNERQAGGERIDERDIGDALLELPERERVAHHLIHIHHRPRGVALAGEHQQAAHDLGGALGLAEDGVETAAQRRIGGLAIQPLGRGENRRQRVVEFVRDARNGLAERRQLLGLQQLLIEVARLIVQTLALADVTHQRIEPEAAVAVGRGLPGHLHPGGGAVGASQAHEMIDDAAIAAEKIEEGGARVRIRQVRGVERTHVAIVRFRRNTEQQLELGIGGRCGRCGADRADEEAVPERVEETGGGRLARHSGWPFRRRHARLAAAAQGDGADGVGVIVGYCALYFCSTARRIEVTGAPVACICMASWATSMQMAQTAPCASQVTWPVRGSRAWMKQSSLPRWPACSQPQKQGT